MELALFFFCSCFLSPSRSFPFFFRFIPFDECRIALRCRKICRSYAATCIYTYREIKKKGRIVVGSCQHEGEWQEGKFIPNDRITHGEKLI